MNELQAVLDQAVTVENILNLAMLVCAAVGSLAFGILVAYGILRAGFALLGPAKRPAVKPTPEVARVPQA